MSPRSAGFDDIEAGYASTLPHEDEELREPEYADSEEDEEGGAPKATKDAELDEFALAEQEYLNEMRSGMHLTEEDEATI
jgi:hypothetical protein